MFYEVSGWRFGVGSFPSEFGFYSFVVSYFYLVKNVFSVELLKQILGEILFLIMNVFMLFNMK